MENTYLPDLLLRQRIVALVLVSLFILLILEFIRRKALKERYAILWLAATFVILPLLLWYDLLKALSHLLGIAYTPLTILLIGIVFVIMILFHFSVAFSKTRRNEAKLVMRIVEQEEKIAELAGKVDALAKQHGAQAGQGDEKSPEGRA